MKCFSMQRRQLLCAGATLPLLAVGARARAAAFPSGPVRIVVPFAPGGALDTVARMIQPSLTRELGQAIIIDNRPGAYNIIGTQEVARAAPDGQTLLFAAAPQALNTALGVKQPYDVMRDFEYVSLVARTPVIFIVHPSLPVHSLKDLVEWSKKQSGGIQFASAGVGSMPHLLGERFFHAEGVKAQHIGYKGSEPALQDLIGGQVKVMVDLFIPSGPQILAGTARGLAVAAAQPLPVLPDVPTMAASGYPGFEAYGFFGVIAPAKTPQPIIDKLNRAIVAATRDRKVHDSLVANGYEVVGSTPKQYRDFVKQQIDLWTPVVKQAHIKV